MSEQGESPVTQRAIPSEIKREVRRRCGFGCVLCGLPLYEYDHIPGFANVQRHLAEEITLLCNMHHTEKTNGLLPVATVEAADANPFNVVNGVTSPYSLHYSSAACRAVIGSNTIEGPPNSDFCAVMIDGIPLVWFRSEDEHLLLNVRLFDEYNRPLLEILDNELVFSTAPWDVEFVAQRLVIRSAVRDIFVDMTFEVPDLIRFNRGRLLLNGAELYLRPHYATLLNFEHNIFASNGIQAPIAICVGQHPPYPVGVYFGAVPRYGIDREAALRSLRRKLEAPGG